MPKVTLVNVARDKNYLSVVDDKGNHLGGSSSLGPYKTAELQEALVSQYGLDETSTRTLLLLFAVSGNTSAEIEVPSVAGKTHFDEPSA